jgi:hypothetical protein
MIPSYEQSLKWLASLPSLIWAIVGFGFITALFMFKVRVENGKPLLPLYLSPPFVLECYGGCRFKS